MPNAWIEHVKRFAKENGLAYGCALSTPACSASYRKPKVQAKQLKEPESESDTEPEPEVIIKPKKRINPEIPIYFVRSNLKKGAYNKAVKQAEKLSGRAIEYLASFPDKSRHHFKQVMYGVINDIEEIRRIDDELKEPDLSPSMIASRQTRLKETERALNDKLQELIIRGFKPSFL